MLMKDGGLVLRAFEYLGFDSRSTHDALLVGSPLDQSQNGQLMRHTGSPAPYHGVMLNRPQPRGLTLTDPRVTSSPLPHGDVTGASGDNYSGS